MTARCYALALLAILPLGAGAQTRDSVPTLGLEGGTASFEMPAFKLRLVRASQTVAALLPVGAESFDFTPADWLERRAADGYYHLGDLTLRYRVTGDTTWHRASTAEHRRP
ncbi:MAG TPA: DUF5695 domain-containing protein, partial [Gemmatimonadales bacterium]